MARKPSKRQLETLRFIEDHGRLYGAPPTMQEIADHFGVSRPSVYQQIVLLEKHGLVERTGSRRARGIRVLAPAEDFIAPVRDVVEIPIRGRVPAGIPFLAEDNIEGHLQVDASLARRGRLFALHVVGESMVGAGIQDGDHVIVREQPLAENGEIVVAQIDGDEATVKRLHLAHDHIELRPENPEFDPIVITQDRRLEIAGKVVSVQRLKGRDE